MPKNRIQETLNGVLLLLSKPNTADAGYSSGSLPGPKIASEAKGKYAVPELSAPVEKGACDLNHRLTLSSAEKMGAR